MECDLSHHTRIEEDASAVALSQRIRGSLASMNLPNSQMQLLRHLQSVKGRYALWRRLNGWHRCVIRGKTNSIGMLTSDYPYREQSFVTTIKIRSIYLMKYPLGRFSPHGKGGKSVYQRAALEAKESYNAGGISLIDAIVALIIVGAVGFGIYAMFTGGGEAVGVLFSFALFSYLIFIYN